MKLSREIKDAYFNEGTQWQAPFGWSISDNLTASGTCHTGYRDGAQKQTN
jgi:neutral trehalase